MANFNWSDESYIIEIGTNIGKTAVFLSKILKNLGKSTKIVSIDPFEFAKDENMNAKGSYSKYIKTIQEENAETNCFPVVTFSENSSEIFKENVGVLLIDECHEYDCTLYDLKNYSKLVCKGGYVFVDDYSTNYPGVKKAFDEWFQNQQSFELVHKESWFVVVKKIE